jgi:hypothetical protein
MQRAVWRTRVPSLNSRARRVSICAERHGCGSCILPAAECGLGTERIPQLLIRDDLQQEIMAQAVGIVGVFVASDDLVDALPQQRQGVVTDTVIFPRIGEELGQVAGQMIALIEGSQRQQTGIAGDLAAGKVSADGLMAVEGEAQLVVYKVSRSGCSETVCWVLRKPSVHAPFRASFFLWPAKSANNPG